MYNKRLILTIFASLMMYCCSGIWAQQRVLLPQYFNPQPHEHDENCDHDGCDHGAINSIPYSSLVTGRRSDSGITTDGISTRRGDISNPSPNFEKKDTIHGAKDVSVVFGAGESTVVRNTEVIWPAAGHPYMADTTVFIPGPGPLDTLYASPTVGGDNETSILVGSNFSKNAVIGIYDNQGMAAGAVSGIRLYGCYSYYPGPPPVKQGTTPSGTYAANQFLEGDSSLGFWLFGDGTPGGNYNTKVAYDAGIPQYDEFGVLQPTAGATYLYNNYYPGTISNTFTTPLVFSATTIPGVVATAPPQSIGGTAAYKYWEINAKVTAADTIKGIYAYPANVPPEIPARFPDGSFYFSGLTRTHSFDWDYPATPYWPAGAAGIYEAVINPGPPIIGPAVLDQTKYSVIATGVGNNDNSGYASVAAILRPYLNTTINKYVVPIWNHASMGTIADIDTAVKRQTSFYFDVITGDSLYTSTRNDAGKKDNGMPLLYKLNTQYSPTGGDTTAYYQFYIDTLLLAQYIRPTTVLVSGENMLERIVVGDVEWYGAFMASHKTDEMYVGPFYTQGTICTHLSGWAAYKRDLVAFDTIQTVNKWGHNGLLKDDPIDGTYASGRYVDAAVRILDEADVCVSGSVIDITTATNTGTISDSEGPYSYLDAGFEEKTNALLVLPGIPNALDESSNFRLKIGGDAYIRHFQDSNYYEFTVGVNNPLEEGFLYRNALSTGGLGTESPGEPFPNMDGGVNTYNASQFDDIWLPSRSGSLIFTEVNGLNWYYDHPREDNTLTYRVGTDSLHWMPYARTEASVYGVKGNYNGHANIHTRTIYDNDTTNIIEIGRMTANQDFFKIYSSGMLKNFRSTCVNECDSITIGVEKIDDNGDPTGIIAAPGFFLSNDTMPLYIINDAGGLGDTEYCYDGGIHFKAAGIDSLNEAIKNAGLASPTGNGGGDLHIQAHSFVRFTGEDLLFDLIKDNEIKVLSDSNAIYVEQSLSFTNADSAHLTFWAKGIGDATRGFTDIYGPDRTGAILIGGNVTAEYQAPGTANNGRGLVLFHSEYDDVLVGGDFTFENTVGQDESGELIVWAGQDIRTLGATTLTQNGQRSILYQARKTVAFEDEFTATMGSTMTNGDLTIKAGYPVFLPNADITNPMNWGANTNDCVAGSYNNRSANQPLTTGGDIWFAKNVNINMTPDLSDSVDMYIRAFNTIHIDSAFNYSFISSTGYTPGSDYRDTTMLYAETGNIEALNRVGTEGVSFTFSVQNSPPTVYDSIYFLLQAGNKLGQPCGESLCFPDISNDNRWKGNILFGNDKTLTVNHHGVGPTLISASRDIENQVGANFTFNYTNETLGDRDSLTITAGRHVETHAPYLFDFSQAGKDITNAITMQAGHLTDGCNYFLCRAFENASELEYNYVYAKPTNPDSANIFAKGGNGNGSILLFDSVSYKYDGKGRILMTALNGNIVSDPYLHGNYPGGAPINFSHEGEGVVRMEAINIKLHDILTYEGASANLKNGQFYMFAYDSILTRNINYSNPLDTGSVFITTDKYKYTLLDCGETNCSAGTLGIHQGHIVLGYGSDCVNANTRDSIVFDFGGNQNVNTIGANLFIKAGFLGYNVNPITGTLKKDLFKNDADIGKGYGGNITFDFLKITMAVGNGTYGGYTEISTPNGNIWGKDSIQYSGINGDLLIDAGLGSVEDTLHAVHWSGFQANGCYGAGTANVLNTRVPLCCETDKEWRTGNIMLKGGTVDFNNTATNTPGKGNVTFRTREGFIDVYDKFDAKNMSGHLLKYAGSSSQTVALTNQWGDLSERDFQYTPVVNSGSVFFGADDNIMLNYGYSNGYEPAYHYSGAAPGLYDVQAAQLVSQLNNPFYSSAYKNNGLSIDDCYSSFNVNVNGYLWYFDKVWKRSLHRLYRGCEAPSSTGQSDVCSPLTGECETIDNGARPLTFNFFETGGSLIQSGGLAVVAANYIDMFTKFTFLGGTGSGLAPVPGMTSLKGESVAGYGLYLKSLFNGVNPEKRRITCFGCGDPGELGYWAEWTYIGFHDDARIYTQEQKSLIEAPVIEFFGHAELDADWMKDSRTTKLNLKADSIIFHDSAIFSGALVELSPYTTDLTMRNNSVLAKRLGVFRDDDGTYYKPYGKAIAMNDRFLPVLEFGYQRCYEPPSAPHQAPNEYSENGGEPTPRVGGDIIVAFKHDFALPILNSVVANHARISFQTEKTGTDYVNAVIRTDLLRIRNKVEFFDDHTQIDKRIGKFEMSSQEQLPSIKDAGIYPFHLHLEPNSELSLPTEDSLIVYSTTTVGGYGEIHENVHVMANGIIAPGYASLMEFDCLSGQGQGRLTIHNLYMEHDAVMRISIGRDNCQPNPATGYRDLYCTQTDTLYVKDSIFFFGKIPLYVLSETEFIEPGCYLFLEYNDLDASVEYVNNLVLMDTKNGDYHFGLDKSERGRVYLCVTEGEFPPIQRYVNIHAIDGVKTDPVSDLYHYVLGHEDFTFKATYANKIPLEVLATGYYSRTTTKLQATYLFDGTYQYTIRQVVQPYDVYFGDVDTSAGDVGNDILLQQRVWSYRNTLFINVDKADIVSIYNMTGILYQKLEIPAGLQKMTLERGIYMITLKDGSVHKIVIN